MILQPGVGPIAGAHYLRSTEETVRWGHLPARDASPVLRVRSGEVVTVDTVSHEGVLEDFDRDPVGWFGAHGVARDAVLHDAIDVAASVPHGATSGPHVVTGPIAVEGAAPGDVLRVDVVGLQMRVPYGVVSNRHGLGALPGEFPEPPATGTVSVFTRTEPRGEGVVAAMPYGAGRCVRYPVAPFLGIMGVTTDTPGEVSSTPPGPHGGNIDVAALQVGATLYLPVQVEGAGFYAGDPHFAQGNGEVCLTALEGSLRADVRLSVLDDAAARRAIGLVRYPFVETDEHWIPVGLHRDLDEALKDAVRRAIQFLETTQGMERHLAYAYLSAAADFEVTQVVDDVKGVHCRIRKADFTDP